MILLVMVSERKRCKEKCALEIFWRNIILV